MIAYTTLGSWEGGMLSESSTHAYGDVVVVVVVGAGVGHQDGGAGVVY